MILFDKLGLAERSKYNPLKVFKENWNLMEINGASFVGKSNWTLDAAKTNKALNLSFPDLYIDLEDLKSNFQSNVESID